MVEEIGVEPKVMAPISVKSKKFLPIVLISVFMLSKFGGWLIFRHLLRK